jgi:MFS family permease
VVAPRRTDSASAWYSASFNVGITGGPVIGGLVLSTLVLRFTPLIGSGLALLGLAAVVAESWPGPADARGLPASPSRRPGSAAQPFPRHPGSSPSRPGALPATPPAPATRRRSWDRCTGRLDGVLRQRLADGGSVVRRQGLL